MCCAVEECDVRCTSSRPSRKEGRIRGEAQSQEASGHPIGGTRSGMLEAQGRTMKSVAHPGGAILGHRMVRVPTV